MSSKVLKLTNLKKMARKKNAQTPLADTNVTEKILEEEKNTEIEKSTIGAKEAEQNDKPTNEIQVDKQNNPIAESSTEKLSSEKTTETAKSTDEDVKDNKTKDPKNRPKRRIKRKIEPDTTKNITTNTTVTNTKQDVKKKKEKKHYVFDIAKCQNGWKGLLPSSKFIPNAKPDAEFKSRNPEWFPPNINKKKPTKNWLLATSYMVAGGKTIHAVFANDEILQNSRLICHLCKSAKHPRIACVNSPNCRELVCIHCIERHDLDNREHAIYNSPKYKCVHCQRRCPIGNRCTYPTTTTPKIKKEETQTIEKRSSRRSRKAVKHDEDIFEFDFKDEDEEEDEEQDDKYGDVIVLVDNGEDEKIVKRKSTARKSNINIFQPDGLVSTPKVNKRKEGEINVNTQEEIPKKRRKVSDVEKKTPEGVETRRTRSGTGTKKIVDSNKVVVSKQKVTEKRSPSDPPRTKKRSLQRKNEKKEPIKRKVKSEEPSGDNKTVKKRRISTENEKKQASKKSKTNKSSSAVASSSVRYCFHLFYFFRTNSIKIHQIVNLMQKERLHI